MTLTRNSSEGSRATLRTGASCPRRVFCWLLSTTSTIFTIKSLENRMPKLAPSFSTIFSPAETHIGAADLSDLKWGNKWKLISDLYRKKKKKSNNLFGAQLPVPPASIFKHRQQDKTAQSMLWHARCLHPWCIRLKQSIYPQNGHLAKYN